MSALDLERIEQGELLENAVSRRPLNWWVWREFGRCPNDRNEDRAIHGTIPRPICHFVEFAGDPELAEPLLQQRREFERLEMRPAIERVVRDLGAS